MDKKNQLSLWYFIGSLSLMPYSEFKQVLRAGGLEDVIVGDGIASGRIRKESLEQVLTPERRKALANASTRRCGWWTSRTRWIASSPAWRRRTA